MGDRAYAAVVVRKSDLPALTEHAGHYGHYGDELKDYDACLKVWGEVLDEGELWVEVAEHEMNGGGWDVWEAAAADGLMFYGFHGSCGGAFDEGAFVALGGVFHGVTQSTYGDILVRVKPSGFTLVRVKPDGDVDEQELGQVQDYLAALKAVKQELGLWEDPPLDNPTALAVKAAIEAADEQAPKPTQERS